MSTDIAASVTGIRSRLPPDLQYIKVVVMNGSDLAPLNLKNPFTMNYDTIPGFQQCTAPGHRSQLTIGFSGKNNVPVMILSGALHYYEGYSMSAIVYPIVVAATMGAKYLFVANAVGSVKDDIPAGSIVVVGDHISFPTVIGFSPLNGQPSANGPFFSLSDIYPYYLRRLAYEASLKIPLEGSLFREGVFGWVPGPMYETRAEGLALESVGTQVVGMEGAAEVVAATSKGMESLMIVVVGDVVPRQSFQSCKEQVEIGSGGPKTSIPAISHSAVMRVCEQKAPIITQIFETVIDKLP